MLLLTDFNGFEGIDELLQRLISVLDQGVVLNGICYPVTASFGASLYPEDGTTVTELMGNADAAMYQAKDHGNNNICFYTTDINDQLVHYQEVTTMLRRALRTDSLQLHYQPQIDLKSRNVRSCEALLRCFDQESRPVSPAVFIPVAEKSGLINDIGNWVIEEACKQLKAWQGTRLETLRVDINLSGKQLSNPHLADDILTKLHNYRLRPFQLGVELTENEVIGSDEAQSRQLEKLQQAGVHISIDDFGTGYSSLVYLRKLPICSLKIDRLFLQHAMENDTDMAIMEAIITVGHRLGLSVIVEGVETSEQDCLVCSLGCDLAQGFLYAKPMPAHKMPAFLSGASFLA